MVRSVMIVDIIRTQEVSAVGLAAVNVWLQLGEAGVLPAACVWHQVQVCSNQFDNRCGRTSRRRRRRRGRWKWGLVWVALPPAD